MDIITWIVCLGLAALLCYWLIMTGLWPWALALIGAGLLVAIFAG